MSSHLPGAGLTGKPVALGSDGVPSSGFVDAVNAVLQDPATIDSLQGVQGFAQQSQLAPLMARTDGVETTNSTLYTDLSGGVTGPQLVIPSVGSWDIEVSCDHLNSVANNIDWMSFVFQGPVNVAATDAIAAKGVSVTNIATTHSRMITRFSTIAAGTVVVCKYRYDATGGAGVVSFSRRILRAWPVFT